MRGGEGKGNSRVVARGDGAVAQCFGEEGDVCGFVVGAAFESGRCQFPPVLVRKGGKEERRAHICWNRPRSTLYWEKDSFVENMARAPL